MSGNDERLGMRPCASAGEVIEALLAAVREWVCSGESPAGFGSPPGDPSLGSRLARHAASVLEAGGSPVDALDSALVSLLFAGESEAMRRAPDGDPEADPGGVRPVASRMLSYPDEVLGASPVRPPALRNRSANLQLMTTRRCHLRCAYCPVVKADRDMPLELMDRAVDLLLSTDRESVRIDFTGGEPMMRWDEVGRTAERALARGASSGKRVGFYMVTSGIGLTAGRARDLASWGCRVELSLDGAERSHNRFKIPLDRSVNPYRSTVDAIGMTLAAGLDHTVVMVVTPDTVASMRENFEHAVRLGVRSIDLNYAIGRPWSGDAIAAYIEALEGIVRDHADIEIGNLTTRVEPAILNAEWMVDTDGSLHLMTEWSLESARPGPFAGSSAGNVHDLESWDSLFAGRFHAYHTLLACYSWLSGDMRRIVHDNVRAGREVSKMLARLRREAT